MGQREFRAEKEQNQGKEGMVGSFHVVDPASESWWKLGTDPDSIAGQSKGRQQINRGEVRPSQVHGLTWCRERCSCASV